MEALRYVYVKNGVANVTNRQYFLRFQINAPDGRYDISMDGSLVPSTKPPLLGYFATPMDFLFDPDSVRPPFEKMGHYCAFPPQEVYRFYELLQEAKKREEPIYIEKTGLGMKRRGDYYVDFPFNLPYKLELDPFYLHLAFTEALRYPTIVMYQEIRQADGDMPITPLVIGNGWENCSLISPIIDHNRRYYS